jgi:hypothetical protein
MFAACTQGGVIDGPAIESIFNSPFNIFLVIVTWVVGVQWNVSVYIMSNDIDSMIAMGFNFSFIVGNY